MTTTFSQVTIPVAIVLSQKEPNIFVAATLEYPHSPTPDGINYACNTLSNRSVFTSDSPSFVSTGTANSSVNFSYQQYKIQQLFEQQLSFDSDRDTDIDQYGNRSFHV